MNDVLSEPRAPADWAPRNDAEPAAADDAWFARAGRRIIRRPRTWVRSPWPDDRIIRTAVTVATLVVTTFIMMRIVHFNPFAWANLGDDDLIFDRTTPTGGDMGAHVWGPAFLRDYLLPNGQLSGWSMDWYSGFPIYRFYMLIPALAIVGLDVFLPYGVAFKVVAVSGLVTLPACCWAFGRLARFRYPMPELFAFAGLCFLLNESYDIYGGNVLSTMAGEFSFSIAVSFMMLGLGTLCRALDTGKYTVWAASLLALACLSHGIVLIYTMLGALIIVVCRSGADLWRLFTRVVSGVVAQASGAAGEVARRASQQTIVYLLLMSPAAVALTVLLAQMSSALYVLTAVVVLAAVVLLVVLCVQLGLSLPENRLFVKRLAFAAVIGALTLALSAFWVGPFLFNHQYMTDMKYAPYPEDAPAAWGSYWEMLFDQKPAIDFIVNSLAIFGMFAMVLRRHVYGIALGLTVIVAGAMVYLAHDGLPIIGLLWNPRVLPWLYLTRYLMMMVGAAELGGFLVNAVRNRPARAEQGVGAASITFAIAALVVLVIFGWVYQVLPFGTHKSVQDAASQQTVREYAWGPARARTTYNNWDRARGWTAYNFQGYEGRDSYPEYYDLMQTMAGIGADPDLGCGRAMWERLDDKSDRAYGTSMALMLLPYWTDGCIASSEGLFFEASGTTPYHFIAVDAMSTNAGSPVRQVRETIGDAAIGVPLVQALGINYVMVATPEAIADADAQPELTPITTSGPWHIYAVAGSDLVVPLDTEPVVVNERTGDQRECWLELGTSWFQQRSEWAALPAADGPDEWQRIDVAVDPARQEPQGQGTDECGDPTSSTTRRVNIVQPASEFQARQLDEVTVTNVVQEQQSVSFDVDQIGVPVLVRVSYFPNWNVEGADGPYRVAPNFMVVVPTSEHVELTYDSRSTLDWVFYGMTIIGLAAAVVIRIRGSVRFPRLDGAATVGAGTLAVTPMIPTAGPSAPPPAEPEPKSEPEPDRLLSSPPPPTPLPPGSAGALPAAPAPPPPIPPATPPPTPDWSSFDRPDEPDDSR
ncbi:hypothetical protein [Desertimonas flava]|uniref:hypothetical protein n=1 Tax=Desertimonas flava TaxID=2064846 RepID=UPI000E353851|nr:hypothetical protein [Desertimonas flava]